MNVKKYCFDDFLNSYEDLFSSNNYLFQYITDRKLSSIKHCHDFYEIVIVLGGSCTQVINDIEYTMPDSSFIILRPSDTHYFTNQSDDVALFCISVIPNEFEKFSEIYRNGLADEINSYENPQLISGKGLFTGIDFPHPNLTDKDNEYEYKFLLSLIIKLYIEISHRKYHLPQSVENAIYEMQKLPNLQGGVPTFVALSGYSRSHLTRIIKNQFNISLQEYVMNLRLNTAYNALLLSEQSTEDISYSVGYASISHFNKIFKSKFGITPSELRKKRVWTT